VKGICNSRLQTVAADRHITAVPAAASHCIPCDSQTSILAELTLTRLKRQSKQIRALRDNRAIKIFRHAKYRIENEKVCCQCQMNELSCANNMIDSSGDPAGCQ
jgi:hypothetical protein